MDSLTTHTPDISRAEALRRRYGAAPPADGPPSNGPWNKTIASLLDHRSVRGFLPDAVPAGTLETLIAAAQSAATSSNMQLWSAITVDDPATRRELATLAGNQKHIEQCPLYLCWIADLSRNERMSHAEQVDFEALPWLETFMVACIDAALAAQNALLGLPPKSFVVFGLCVGYADPAAKNEVKPRLPQSTVLHRERYDATPEARDRAAYDAELEKFSARNEMAATTWTRRMFNRMGPIASMNGRERLRATLARLGFEIR